MTVPDWLADTFEHAGRDLASLPEWARPVTVVPTAARCHRCCEHGIPWKGAEACLWCEDVALGWDAPIAPQDPQWLCPHGVGHDYALGGSQA